MGIWSAFRRPWLICNSEKTIRAQSVSVRGKCPTRGHGQLWLVQPSRHKMLPITVDIVALTAALWAAMNAFWAYTHASHLSCHRGGGIYAVVCRQTHGRPNVTGACHWMNPCYGPCTESEADLCIGCLGISGHSVTGIAGCINKSRFHSVPRRQLAQCSAKEEKEDGKLFIGTKCPGSPDSIKMHIIDLWERPLWRQRVFASIDHKTCHCGHSQIWMSCWLMVTAAAAAAVVEVVVVADAANASVS